MEKEQSSTRKVPTSKTTVLLLVAIVILAVAIWLKYFTGTGPIVPSRPPHEARTWGTPLASVVNVVGVSANETTGTVILYLKIFFKEKSYYVESKLPIRGTIDNETEEFTPWITVKKEKQ